MASSGNARNLYCIKFTWLLTDNTRATRFQIALSK